MLKIIAFIQCDICDELLSEIATASDPRADSDEQGDGLVAELHSLRLTAEARGWSALKDSTVHYCPSCNRR